MTAPEVLLEFVTVPELFIGLVENVIVPPVIPMIVKLFVPVTPPLKTVLLLLLVTLSVPVFPDASTIGFANVEDRDAVIVALSFPLVSPRVTVPVPLPPNALVLVLPITVPFLIVRPPVKVFIPVSVSIELVLF